MVDLYKHSRSEAIENDELDLWRESYNANRECKSAIEKAISANFDGFYLNDESAESVIAKYGFDRTMWVLAATVNYKSYDGRFSKSNKNWAKEIVPSYIYEDELFRYAVNSHPAVLDGFIDIVRKEYAKLNLLDRSKCIAEDKEYAGKLLIIKPETLKEQFRKPYFQYFYAQSGFGCYPDKLGSKVFGRFLADGEECHFYRSDFLGVADTAQLPQWASQRFENMTAPKMKIRVFQIDSEKDGNRLKFRSLNEVMENGGLDSAIYHQVYGGIVNAANIEDVFALCNLNHPPGYYGHSLSVSDVVEICEGENKGFYYCDTIGFKKVDFDIEKIDRSDMLKVIILECGKEPYIAEIRDELKAKQSVVGGLIEPVYFTDDNVLIYCDEEFLLKEYSPNRKVGDIVIHGTFMVLGDGVNDEGENVEISLTDEQIEKYSEMFKYPLVYMTNEELAEMQGFEETESMGFSQT